MLAAYRELVQTCIQQCIAVSKKEEAFEMLSKIKDTCKQAPGPNSNGDNHGTCVLSDDETFCKYFKAMGEKWGEDPDFALEFSETIHHFRRSYYPDLGFGTEVADMGTGRVLVGNLEVHRNSPKILQKLIESLLPLLYHHHHPMQNDLGKDEGCDIVISILQQYMENEEVVKSIIQLIAYLVSTNDDRYVSRNYKRLNKMGACEVIVEVLKKYVNHTDIANYAVQAIADMSWACPRNQDRFLKLGACPLIVDAVKAGCIDSVNDAISGMGRKCAEEYLQLGAPQLLAGKTAEERCRLQAAIVYLKVTKENKPVQPENEEAVRSDTSYDGEDDDDEEEDDADDVSSEDDEDSYAMEEEEEEEDNHQPLPKGV